MSNRAKPRKDEKAGAATAADPRAPVLHIKIDLASDMRLGPGKIDLLERIAADGSLSKAADAMGISYRRAWQFIQHINAAFDEPAVATPEHGHGGSAAKLTPFGVELVKRYRALEAEVQRAAAPTTDWLARHRSG